MGTYFKTSLDFLAKSLTGLVFLFLISGLVMMFTLQPWYGGLIVLLLFFVVLALSYLNKVSGYLLTNEKLIIRRPFTRFDKEIPFSDIVSVRHENEGEFTHLIRGGLFGYVGILAGDKDYFTMYATRRKNCVVITLRQAPHMVVVSPDDVSMTEAIVERLQANNR